MLDPFTCPACGGELPQGARYCLHCGASLAPSGTVEMVPEPPSVRTREQLAARPAELRATVHAVHRRPFGLSPVSALGAAAGIALLITIVLFATGAWIAGIIVLGGAVALSTLFVSAVSHDPAAPAAVAAIRAAAIARSTARVAIVALRSWSTALLSLVRVRQRRHRLRRELRNQLGPLGEAVLREDHRQAAAHRAQAAEIERELRAAEREESDLLERARATVDREKRTAQPTTTLRGKP